MYPLFETICAANGRTERLEYHEERRIRALDELFHTTPKASLKEILAELSLPREEGKLFKVVVRYDAADCDVSVHSYVPKKINTLRMAESDADYSHKWTNREALTKLLSDDAHEEVIIVKNGWVADATFANLVFKKEGKWFTPRHCLLKGTMRQYLLDKNQIEEIPIRSRDVGQFSHVRLINSMLRFAAPPLPVSKIIPLP